MNIHFHLRNAATSEPDERLLTASEWTAMHKAVREQLNMFGTCQLFMASSFNREVAEVVIFFEADKSTINTGFTAEQIIQSILPILKKVGMDMVTTLTGDHVDWDAYAH